VKSRSKRRGGAGERREERVGNKSKDIGRQKRRVRLGRNEERGTKEEESPRRGKKMAIR